MTFRLTWETDPPDVTFVSIEEFRDANRDDPDTVAELEALEVGQGTVLGGGAAPFCAVCRMS